MLGYSNKIDQVSSPWSLQSNRGKKTKKQRYNDSNNKQTKRTQSDEAMVRIEAAKARKVKSGSYVQGLNAIKEQAT